MSGWGLFTLDLELTNLCAEACSFCPRHAITRPQGVMPTATAEGVARLLTGVSQQVTFSGMGDPVSHPDLVGCVAAFRNQGIPAGVQVSAAGLTPGRIACLVEAQPAFINLSLPSVTPAVLAHLLPHRDPDGILACARALAEAARPRIRVTLIATRTALETDEAGVPRLAEALGVGARVAACHSRGGNLEDARLVAAEPAAAEPAPCGLFARHGFVTWEGDLLACCHDLRGETRLGSLIHDPLDRLLALKDARSPG